MGLTTNSNSFVVDKIEIIGNERTEEFVILRELSFTIGDTVNSEILFFSRERVFSLGIFTKVTIKLDEKDNANVVVIYIEESWYIFPVPFFVIREKTFDRTSYGISLKYKNFRGRNETIRATISLGYDPFYSMQYENPLLIPSADISFYFSGAIGTFVNKSVFLDAVNGSSFNFESFLCSTTFGKRVNKQNNFFVSLAYSRIKAPFKILSGYMASGTLIDEIFSAGISYIFDSRDLRQFATSGSYFQLSYMLNGIGNNTISYNNMGIDVKSYREIYNSLMIKGRMSGRHIFGENIPFYSYSRLGYTYYTRGNRYLVREGNTMLLSSVELSYPILPEWNFAMDLPVLPNSLTRTRIAIHLGAFVDVATVFSVGDKVYLNDFNSGYGFGITVLFLPYNIFRFEYAFNEMGKGEFLLETGISF